MSYLIMIELLDSDGNFDRLDGMTVVGDLQRAEIYREKAHEFYESRGYAVCVKIYSSDQLLKALGRV